MRVVVTGAAGFLGARLARVLLSPDCELRGVTDLVLVDALEPALPVAPPGVRVHAMALDLAAPGAAEQLITSDTTVLFHLAAVVSGHAEADFDLGLRVNFDATRALLEEARRQAPKLIFVFVSTAGVYGGQLPPSPDEDTAPLPDTTYGCSKAMAELLVSEYGRRGFADGRAVRLPTVSVRGGAANRAVTSFASGVVREPLAGKESLCPVPATQAIWLAGPANVVNNIVHAAVLPTAAWARRRVLVLPGLTVTVGEMVAALRRVAGDVVASRVRFQLDAPIAAMVATFPTQMNAARALALGFTQDNSYDDIIRQYIRDDLNGKL